MGKGQSSTGHPLFIIVEDEHQARRLVRFLGSRSCTAQSKGTSQVIIEDCARDSPGLATVVALVEEWRCAERVPEIALELGGERRILRTET